MDNLHFVTLIISGTLYLYKTRKKLQLQWKAARIMSWLTGNMQQKVVFVFTMLVALCSTQVSVRPAVRLYDALPGIMKICDYIKREILECKFTRNGYSCMFATIQF